MADPILTPPFRVSFPQVFEAKAYGNQKPKFSVTMLFDSEADLTELKAAARAAAIEKFGEGKTKGLKSPFRDGKEKEHLDGYGDGITFVRATSEVQPQVLDRSKQEIISQRDFYAGCYARALVVPFGYDNSGNRGVSFGLRGLQKLADGDAFGAGGDVTGLFPDDAGDAPAGSTPSGDDDIPF